MSMSKYKPTSSSSTASIRSQLPEFGLAQDSQFLEGMKDHAQLYNDLFTKNYMAGYLKKKNDLGPDKTPFIQRKWTDWYVELNGPTLMFWSVKSKLELTPDNVLNIKKKTPNFINISDCNVYTQNGEEFQFVLNSAGANRFYLKAIDDAERDGWVKAMRLACFEASLIHENYTHQIMTSTLFTPMAQSQKGQGYSGYVDTRCSGTLEWCRFWMEINPTTNNITFSSAQYDSDYVYTLHSLQQSYAIYPDKLELVDQSTVIRLDGEVQAHRDSQLDTTCPPFILVMATSHVEMVSILLATYDSFNLYGRPSQLITLPLPEDDRLYFELDQIKELNVEHVPIFDTRQSLLELISNRFGLDHKEENVSREVENDAKSELYSEPEENEFEPPHSLRSYPTPKPAIDGPVSALSPQNKPKIRKSLSVKWKEPSDNEGDSEDENSTSSEKETKPAVDSDDSDSEEEFPIVNRKKEPVKPTKRLMARTKPVASDESSEEDESEEDDDEDVPMSSRGVISPPKLDVVIEKVGKLSLDDYESSQRPQSNHSALSQTPSAGSSKPYSMTRKESNEVNPSKGRKPLRSKVQLPTASDGSSDDEGQSKQHLQQPQHGRKGGSSTESLPRNSSYSNARQIPNQYQQQPQQGMYGYSQGQPDDDDAPIGMNPIAADPYANPYNPMMMRSSVYSGVNEYAHDMGGYYPPDMMMQQQGFDGGAYSNYNPALQRPSTLLEASDYQRYNAEQLQPRFGPLIQLPDKKADKKPGGLVGAISALEQQRAANKYTNANARMSHHHGYQQRNPEMDRERQFEMQKERYLQEQRALASQSQIFPPEFGYQQSGYNGGMAPPRGPYANPSASLSAGSFYQQGPSGGYPGLLSPSLGQGGHDLGQGAMYRTMDDSQLGGYFQPPQPVPGDMMYPPTNQFAYPPQGNQLVSPSSSRHPIPYDQSFNAEEQPANEAPDSEDDDKPVGQIKPAVNPMFAKGRYRQHTTTQIKLSKLDSEDDTESEPEIDADVQDTFEEFVDARLQMKPYAYEPPERVYQKFIDWCQDEDLDEDVPDDKTFMFMMKQQGFVLKKRPENARSQVKSEAEEWWYNICIVE